MELRRIINEMRVFVNALDAESRVHKLVDRRTRKGRVR